MYKENVNNDFEANKVIEEIKELSEKYGILYELNEKFTVLNLNDKTSYLGSIKVFDEDKLPEFKNNIKKLLNKYGNISIRSQNVVSCCSPRHSSINFKLDIPK